MDTEDWEHTLITRERVRQTIHIQSHAIVVVVRCAALALRRGYNQIIHSVDSIDVKFMFLDEGNENPQHGRTLWVTLGPSPAWAQATATTRAARIRYLRDIVIIADYV